MDKGYKELVESIKNPNIDTFIEISKLFVPEQFKHYPWTITNHGVGVYTEEVELACYMAAYGEMHKKKMEKILSDFPIDNLDQPFEIIDRGCGQGIATICTLDFLRKHNKLSNLKSITLIEPSRVALNRAVLNISCQTKGHDIRIEANNDYLPGHKGDGNIFNGHTVIRLSKI